MAWIVWLPLGVGTAIGTFRSIAFGTFADPLLAAPLLLVVLVLAGVCILRTIILLGKLVVQGSFLRATCTLVASLAAWLIAVFMIFGNGGDDVHLGLAYPSYLLSGRLGAGRSDPVEFTWETYQIALGGQGTRTLVYAPDGRIGGVGTSMPPITDAQTWRTVRPLIGGFILVTTIEN